MKRHLIFLSAALLALCVLSPADESPGSPGPDETAYSDKVKAVFLHHFLRYIQWPDDNAAKPYHIAFIGDSDIIPPLKQIAAKATVNNRKIIIDEYQHFLDVDIDNCHLLFICQPETVSLKDTLENAAHRHILTVSHHDGFAQKGVAINFVLIKGKITFEINVKTLKKAGLYPSSQILKLAVLVEGNEDGDAGDNG